MRETSKALWRVFFQYTHLSLGGKEIVCPYWMNKTKQDVFGPLGGKGKPEEIVEVVEKEAKEAGINLDHLSAKAIISFMKRKKIGVDCSGFVYWALDAFDREQGGNGIKDDIPGSAGRYIKERASVKMMVQASRKIDKISQIKVGDLLVNEKINHVAIVLSVERIADNSEIRITYANSKKPRGVYSEMITSLNKNNGYTDIYRLKSF